MPSDIRYYRLGDTACPSPPHVEHNVTVHHHRRREVQVHKPPVPMHQDHPISIRNITRTECISREPQNLHSDTGVCLWAKANIQTCMHTNMRVCARTHTPIHTILTSMHVYPCQNKKTKTDRQYPSTRASSLSPPPSPPPSPSLGSPTCTNQSASVPPAPPAAPPPVPVYSRTRTIARPTAGGSTNRRSW